VIARFLELTGDKDLERDKAIAQAAIAKEKTLKELAADREAIAKRANELDQRRQQLEDQLREELAQIAKEDQPLVQELARLDARASSLSRDLSFYEGEVVRLQAAAAVEMDPNRRFLLEREAERLLLATGRIEADLIGVNRLGDGVQAQRAGLAARQRKTQVSAAEQTKRIDQEANGLARRERLNDALEKRAAKPATGSTSKGRSLAAQAAAFSTYDQFPLESARQKLLESLR
jgi:hypothetical protein